MFEKGNYMPHLITRIASLSVLAIVILGLIAGCGGKEKEKGSELELFAQAQEFQKDEKFEDAIGVYRKIVRDFSDTRQGANSQFMIGFIYANHLSDSTQARIELQRFLDNFSAVADSGLIAGAEFELRFMGKDIEDIPILSELGEGEPLDTSK